MLYIITKPENLPTAATFVTESDEILLTQSAVYLANPKHFQHTLLKGLSCSVSVLTIDLQARGIEALVAQGISLTDMDQFVDLTAKHQKSISW